MALTLFVVSLAGAVLYGYVVVVPLCAEIAARKRLSASKWVFNTAFFGGITLWYLRSLLDESDRTLKRRVDRHIVIGAVWAIWLIALFEYLD
jgi:hypothetical protein